MEAAEDPEIIDGILIVDDGGFLRRSKTPYHVNPEITEDIVDAGACLYVAIASQ